ncbi:hypothetical protein FVF58_01265 [Paraburkholderia panacisoli]|uniref:Uncharacterized protein n=1 Tax=Paraburkholderia panacisoli TaxID=2603818 RepID=A0A5B0HLA5_9BURK|nr:hypothetical protein [Paraburkholderia panacisoli]KAA1016009.1 hypothetical protein FVF58_01265 [Paraburkholderia panacisoli]
MIVQTGLSEQGWLERVIPWQAGDSGGLRQWANGSLERLEMNRLGSFAAGVHAKAGGKKRDEKAKKIRARGADFVGTARVAKTLSQADGGT